MPETTNTWTRVLDKVQQKVNTRSFKTWFGPTRYLDDDAARVVVRVPNPWFADWLTTHYWNVIEESLREIQRPGLQVEFRPEFEDLVPGPVAAAPSSVAGPSGDRRIGPRTGAGGAGGGRGGAGTAPTNGFASGSGPGSAVAAAAGRAEPALAVRPRPAVERAPAPYRPELNPKYSFDSFVVSSCNQFAHAASVAVADQPSRSYNPLYIYGGVGLGKTHLMQAIGNRIVGQGSLRMHYISSETFMNDLINAIRFERTHEFKEQYRNVDVLLIDDIQFLAGKERTQEEFFHTFNALYDAQKQIVITSDVPPRDIPTLEDRLRSRFEWGLIADIQPPDLETRVAILRKKAEQDGTAVSDDVTLFIASHCGTNIRELEGALTKIVAYASMSGRSISVDLAKEQLRDFMPSESPATTVESIQKLVANYYELKVSDLKARNNSPQVAQPRQLAMYLCKKLTSCSLPEIGRRFGDKHHSTVLHAIKQVDKRRAADRDFDNLVESLMRGLS